MPLSRIQNWDLAQIYRNYKSQTRFKSREIPTYTQLPKGSPITNPRTKRDNSLPTKTNPIPIRDPRTK